VSEDEWSHVPRRLAALRERVAAAAARAGRDPAGVRVVAVCKTVPPAAVQAAYAAGHREFGENRVPEALAKIDAVAADVVWHLVGHLQTNKVNKALGRFELIHSLDSTHLAERLDAKGREREIVTQVLVQVNCSGETAKHGLDPAEAEDFVLSLRGRRGILVRGLMTMGPLGGGEAGARESFRLLASLHRRLRGRDLPDLPLDHLSMGMSDDYEVAVEEGATLLRVGRAIFAP
jgi:pyridoxal phosphate enzyme (YggS family)